MGKFILDSQFAPAGDQPQAIQKITQFIHNGAQYSTLVGVRAVAKLTQWQILSLTLISPHSL